MAVFVDTFTCGTPNKTNLIMCGLISLCDGLAIKHNYPVVYLLIVTKGKHEIYR